ncbi:hypothetical protein O181_016577 [Austropuccinia psidii MF-1]|uniref:Uncharacterized protein n=1 Tax=Austropuccinia psidii MF-1 TaxID=1389203 RepID=A0A9Q3GRT7_9BASI|nr:hypothetical protein [Austropuccinia psidii MF-1]
MYSLNGSSPGRISRQSSAIDFTSHSGSNTAPPSPPSPLLIFSLAYNLHAAAWPSSYASDTTLTPPYASLHPSNMPPTLLAILMLAVPSQHASNTPYHPYACGVPSRHASNGAYHLYARIVPARHASDACSALPTCLQRRLPSLRFQ